VARARRRDTAPHRYLFRLHALDAEPDVGSGAGRRELESALSGHVQTTAELMGTYQRYDTRVTR
jgi:phosphatidylethanolamine-binding protein (PEBP) family uncharacterized protein